MPIQIIRLGSRRLPGEGTRIGRAASELLVQAHARELRHQQIAQQHVERRSADDEVAGDAGVFEHLEPVFT